MATDGTTLCTHPAAYRCTWPGRDEVGVCEEHAAKLRAVASVMGLHLQLIPVAPGTGNCEQKVDR
jgi:hypothetical protein